MNTDHQNQESFCTLLKPQDIYIVRKHAMSTIVRNR